MMRDVRLVRGRSGALFWQVYEDVAHPEGWLEVWSMESWTDHLREVVRLSEDDKQLLARLSVFQVADERPQRYLAVDPNASADAPAGPRGLNHHTIARADASSKTSGTTTVLIHEFARP